MSTYSFEDVTCSLQHDGVGSESSTGAGVGSITTTMTTERTVHDVAADGIVMITKVPGKNGLVAIAMQQNSDLNKWLLKWYNYVDTADSSEWAGMTITIKSKNLGDVTTCTQVSPQKLPDRPYQAQGQHVTWNLMAAKIAQS